MAELNAKFSIEQKRLRVAFNLEQTTIPAIFKINAAGTTWGSIAGNIQNQTDLYAILQDKASVESVENLAETVQDNYDTLDAKIDDTESALAGQITALSDTVDINNQNINNRVDTVVETVSNLTDTVSDNYTELSNDISVINTTISNYGDIVTYDAANFATSAQGSLADSALQPNDNISELNNDVGYITSASLPTVNNGSLTIQRNGSQVAVFTANDAQNITANILVPTQASDIGALPDSTTIADLTTQAQLNAINSGATATNIGQITTNENDIADIRDLIPTQATTSNQLADKAFVNSSIATNTAYFIGTFNSVAELEAYSGTLTNNDYAFVATTDAAGNTLYDRYKYNADTQQWIFEYELNNSSFTAVQWAAINSGMTSGDVSLIQTALQPNDNISELVNDAGYITSASLPTVNNGTLDIQVNGTSIGTFTANQAGNTTANITMPIVDQIFDATSANAQSGVAISGAGFIVNNAINATSSIAVDYNPQTTYYANSTSFGVNSRAYTQAVGIGYNAKAGANGVCLGWGTSTSGTGVSIGYGARCTTASQNIIAIGYYATSSALDAIQIGNGTNSTANTLQIRNRTLLDLSTGKIPNDRLNIDQTFDGTSANAQSGVAIAGALNDKQDTLVSGTNIKTINGTSVLGSGDIAVANQSLSNLDATGQAVIDGKADVDLSNVPSSKGILTESYVNGTSWYRVYSDGWCEQGGSTGLQGSDSYTRTTITFLKPFVNTDYTIISSPNKYSTQNGLGVAYPPFIYTKNTNTCIFGGFCWTDGFDWYACGYIN